MSNKFCSKAMLVIMILMSIVAGGAGATDQSRSRKVHNPAADAKHCVQVINDGSGRGAGTSGHARFVNNCGIAVEIFWCTPAECARGSGNSWTVRAGGGWPISDAGVRWGACKGANSGGFDRGSEGHKYTCPNLAW